MLLEVSGLTVLYDRAMLLNGVCLSVADGESVGLVGPNGAGKTTLLRAIAGLVGWEKEELKGTKAGRIMVEGSVLFGGEEIVNTPAHEIARKGLILCPERGRPFRELTVIENLKIGAHLCRDSSTIKENLGRVYELFPILKERENQISGTLSGGERTMLAISRALMSEAKLLMIDEPSTGLAPAVKEDLFARISQIHELGITILLTEQDVSYAFDVAARSYVLSRGNVIAEGTSRELLGDELLARTYLGL